MPLPPQDNASETCVLGSMLLDKDCIDLVIEIVQPEQFYSHHHQVIYQAMLSLYENNSQIDLVILQDELTRQEKLAQIGGIDYLVELAESVPSSANAEYYARIVRDKARQRSIIKVCDKVSKGAYGPENVADFLSESEREIYQAFEEPNTGKIEPISSVAIRVADDIFHRDRNKMPGLPTGYVEYDKLTGGLYNGEFIVIGARPSMGKTALGMNIAEYISIDNEIPTLVFSIEMSKEAIFERMVTGRAGVDSHAARMGYLPNDERQMVADMSAEFANSTLMIDDSTEITPSQIIARSRRYHRTHNIGLIAIDYIQNITVPGMEKEPRLAAKEASRKIKALARELDIPIIMMAQLNRAPDARPDHRPFKSDLAECGTIEQDADVIMLLLREDYYHKHDDKDYTPDDMAKVYIDKNRNGKQGMITLGWNGPCVRFYNV